MGEWEADRSASLKYFTTRAGPLHPPDRRFEAEQSYPASALPGARSAAVGRKPPQRTGAASIRWKGEWGYTGSNLVSWPFHQMENWKEGESWPWRVIPR
jgi:hypothetical protein